MEVNRRQVSVSDLPLDVTEEDLELLIESPSFCPDGGDVECVDVDENTRTAVITLEDECGTHNYCFCNFVLFSCHFNAIFIRSIYMYTVTFGVTVLDVTLPCLLLTYLLTYFLTVYSFVFYKYHNY